MRVGIAITRVPFLRSRVEGCAEELAQALQRAGHQAEVIPIPFNGRPESRLPEQLLACRLLDLEDSVGTRIDRLIALSFPAYLVPHTEKVVWLLRQCRAANTLWKTSDGSLSGAANGAVLRRLIRDSDARLLREARAVFVPSRSGGERLHEDFGISAKLLQAPPFHAEQYRHEDLGDFFFVLIPDDGPSREDLILQALQSTRHPVQIRLLSDPGRPIAESGISGLPALPPNRIVHVSPAEKDRLALFGNCLAVVYVAVDEVDNAIALESMLAGKALVTTDDSGGIADLVRHERTGLVCSPNPESLATVLDRLWEDRALALRLGQAARAHYEELRLTWDAVAERVLA